MYVPSMYRAKDQAWLRFVLRSYPFATLVSNGPQAPYATHLPAILPAGTPASDDLVGEVLLGHMNRANPHWTSLSDGAVARLIFTGPQSYVTPAVYHTVPAAPTWDFISVHLVGRLDRITDLEGTLRVVRLTVDAFEKDFGDGWDPEPSLQHFRRIAPGVGAFRFRVEASHAMFKLSQEKDSEIQDRIIGRFAARASGPGPELARIMRELGLGG